MNLNNICIVGGGSAGWMTASILLKHFGKTKEITVIEADIPRIGVGESTTQLFNNFIKYLGLKDKEWMPPCNATYKHSVKFTKFNLEGSFHYPFGTGNNIKYTDYFNWRHNNNVNPMTFSRVMSPIVDVIEDNKLYPDYFDCQVGYHVDALLFAEYLKNEYAIPKGITYIRGEVIDYESGWDGISKLYLSDGKYIEADLFIDCTGFKGLLMNHVGSKWIDWRTELKNDSTWAVRLPYTDKKAQLRPYTECTGMSAGWMWDVPTWEHRGVGYNYCSQYISDEEALQEFKLKLDQDIPENCFRLLKWQTGIREEVWCKNVIGIGLSSGFIEPLESGGLYSVHEFLFKLIQVLPKDIKKWNGFIRTQFNTAVTDRFTEFKNFVVSHYTMGFRDDTPFWKEYTNMNDVCGYPHLLTLHNKQLGLMNDLEEGYAALLGGYKYDIITEPWESNWMPLLTPNYSYPNAYDYYKTHLYVNV